MTIWFMMLVVIVLCVFASRTEQFAGTFIRLLPEDPLFRTQHPQQLALGQTVCSREFPGSTLEGATTDGGYYCKNTPAYACLFE